MKKHNLLIIPCLLLFIFSERAFAKALPRVAILPFQNLSTDKSISWIGPSIAKEISLELTKYPKIKVVDSLKVEKTLAEIILPKGTIPVGIAKKIGGKLNASYIVFGDFQKFSQYVRVVAYIFDVKTGRVKETIKSNGKIDEIFTVQESIVRKTKLTIAGLVQESTPPAPAKPKISRKRKPSVDEDALTRKLMEEELGKGGLNKNVEDQATLELMKKEASDLSAEDWFRKGVQLSNDSDQEIFYYKKALEVDPKFADAYYNLGIVYMHRGNNDEAKRNFLKYMRYGTDPLKRSKIMALLQQLGDEYSVFSGGDREAAQYWYNKGVELSNDSDQEMNYYRWAIYSDPTFAPAHYNLANIYYKRGMYAKALKEYKIYMQYSQNDPPEIRNRVTEIINYLEKVVSSENR